jgi:ribosomal protein L3 glutamine methyltransferase
MTDALDTILDWIRYGATRLAKAELNFGHHNDNPLDEAKELVLHVLKLPHDLPAAYGAAKLLPDERAAILALIERRINERIPAAYLTGEAYFAGLPFKSDRRALVPRSPIGELIRNGFSPWLDERPFERVLDLCTGSGVIGLATAVHFRNVAVDLVDLSKDALELARSNVALHGLENRTRLYHGDLFAPLAKDTRYDLIVSNPPYVTENEFAALPPEYAHEPALGLVAGDDGLDIALRILRDAPDWLEDHGLLIVEVGEAEHALTALLPKLPLTWLEFSVGEMGVFAIEANELKPWQASLKKICTERGLA